MQEKDKMKEVIKEDKRKLGRKEYKRKEEGS